MIFSWRISIKQPVTFTQLQFSRVNDVVNRVDLKTAAHVMKAALTMLNCIFCILNRYGDQLFYIKTHISNKRATRKREGKVNCENAVIIWKVIKRLP